MFNNFRHMTLLNLSIDILFMHNINYQPKNWLIYVSLQSVAYNAVQRWTFVSLVFANMFYSLFPCLSLNAFSKSKELRPYTEFIGQFLWQFDCWLFNLYFFFPPMSFQMKVRLAGITKHMNLTANCIEQTTFAIRILTEWASTALSLVVFAVSI